MKKGLVKPFSYVTIKNKSYISEVVNNEEKRLSGLSRRTKLENGHGMLFIFDEEDKHAFTMKDTYLPLDMVFINKNLKIVDYIQNAQPLSNEQYKPKEKCLYVLEVSGNDLKDEIEIGNLTKINFFSTLDDINAYKEKKSLAESLTKYLNEAVNSEEIRRKQKTPRKNSFWG